MRELLGFSNDTILPPRMQNKASLTVTRVKIFARSTFTFISGERFSFPHGHFKLRGALPRAAKLNDEHGGAKWIQ